MAIDTLRGSEADLFLYGTNKEGSSALTLAACEKSSDTMMLLLDCGADANHQDTSIPTSNTDRFFRSLLPISAKLNSPISDLVRPTAYG